MSRHTSNKEMVAIGLLAIILAILATADAAPLVNSVGKATTTFMTTTTTRRRYSIHRVSPHLYETLKKTRGGATLVDSDDEYDSEGDEYDEYDDEEEEEEDAALTKSAVAAAAKARSKKTKVSKKAVSASLSRSKAASIPKKKKISVLRKIPYIVKACMNPFTVMSMTKAYFASLFNVNYLEEDTSQTLRSALQEKAKKSSGSPGKKGRGRKMRPGQAKTLSDLPQLSA